MSGNVRLTPRDIEIAQALCHCVRYFSADQLRKGWWQKNSKTAFAMENRLRKLVQINWLGTASCLARPMPELDGPLYAWHPGKSEPDFGHYAWLANKRWDRPPVMTKLYFAGRRAAHQYLGTRPRRVRQIYQLTHDLGVSEVYLYFKAHRKEEVSAWYGESVNPFRKPRIKNADVYIFPTLKWPPKLVVDFAGAYPKSRIQALHQYCVENNLAYELW